MLVWVGSPIGDQEQPRLPGTMGYYYLDVDTSIHRVVVACHWLSLAQIPCDPVITPSRGIKEQINFLISFIQLNLAKFKVHPLPSSYKWK